MNLNWKLLSFAMSVSLALSLSYAFLPTAQADPLPGSSFEGDDGNLLVTTPGNLDWENAPNLSVQVDKQSGPGDDAFGQGAKEDKSDPTVVNGSIPPNKSDLSRFYVSHEKAANGHIYLYLAWERFNVLGSANMDFEFNQVSTPKPVASGGNGVTPPRTVSDTLITFDFVNGGSTPVLGLLTWVVSGTTSQCYSSNTLPCWGLHEDLSGSHIAAGRVNTVTVTDPVNPDAPRQLLAGTFGEAAIDLTLAGVFPADKCVNLGSAYLKSRSSASFTAEIKDFIAPKIVSVTNCGGLTVRKFTIPPNAPGVFGFSSNAPGLSPTFTLTSGGFIVNPSLPAGTYTITENDPTPAFDLTDLTCVTSDSGTSASISKPTATITMAGGGTVECVYTNTQRSTLNVIKVTNPVTDTPEFNFTAGGGLDPTSFKLKNNGVQTFANVPPGSGYNVTETVQTGWDITGTVCSDGSPVSNIDLSPGETVTCTFYNRAQGAIQILKVDDSSSTPSKANPLKDAEFTLYNDAAPTGGTRGNEDTSTGKTCTTDVAGTCSFDNLEPGNYWVVETKTPTGYNTAPDQPATVTPGETVSLIFTDPRLFKIIVLVCRQSDNKLYASDVTINGVKLTSLPPDGGLPITDAQLCALGGAAFPNNPWGQYSANIAIPQ